MLTAEDYVAFISNYRAAVETDRPQVADAMKQAFKALLMRGCDSQVGDMIVEEVFGGQF